MNSLSEQSVSAALEAVAAEQDRQWERNKHRLALLLLLSGLAGAIRVLVRAEYERLLGRLLLLAGTTGEIPTNQFGPMRQTVRTSIAVLKQDVSRLVMDQLPEIAVIGAELGGAANVHDTAAYLAALKAVEHGARGVPLRDVYDVAFAQTMNNVASIVQRGIAAHKTVKEFQPDVERELTTTMFDRIDRENFQQLSKAFTEATRAAAEGSDKLLGYIWNLSPMTDNHCDICTGRDGNLYAPDDPVLDELGSVHKNCMCYATPKFERENE